MAVADKIKEQLLEILDRHIAVKDIDGSVKPDSINHALNIFKFSSSMAQTKGDYLPNRNKSKDNSEPARALADTAMIDELAKKL